MASIIIHRGTHQIGGCCTQLCTDETRILIDIGTNLPGTDEHASISDQELIDKVFQGNAIDYVLFTHCHGDHYGLYQQIPSNIPMYIGPVAKEILKIVASYTNQEEGKAIIEQMRTYQAGKKMNIGRTITIMPLYVDHSAADAYMFYLEAAGKTILFTGDFREHGIVGERERMWRVLEKFVPKNIDVLITEGTILSRTTSHNMPRTEEELGQQAAVYFSQKKYNFVLVSSTNMDSIMEFYHNTPKGKDFICDLYQAEIMLTAMKGMEQKGFFPKYRKAFDHPVIYVLGKENKRWETARKIGKSLKDPISIEPISSSQMYKNGFVMLVRKNLYPQKKSTFEKMRDSFYHVDGQIIYSLWDGYLEGKHMDSKILAFIGNRPIIHLHTSGHAYAETIARLIKTVNPKTIIPMHTECADTFAERPELAPYKDRITVLNDGEEWSWQERKPANIDLFSAEKGY